MGYAHDVLSLVADALDDVAEYNDFSFKSKGNGLVTVSGTFRLKQNKKSADAMDAAIKPIKTKPTIKATFSECKSKNPMRCRYHGALYAQNAFKAILTRHGVDAGSVEVKRVDEGTYDFKFDVPDANKKSVCNDLRKFMDEHDLEPVSFDKEDGYYSVMYEAEEVLDPDEENAVNGLKEDAKNASESLDELEGMRGTLSSDDEKELGAEIENQRARAAEMNETIEMLGATDVDDEWGDEEDEVGYVPPAKTLPTLPPLPQSLDDLSFVKGNIGGSTGPTLWKDKDGNMFVMKTGGTAGGDPEAHVTNEYYGLKAYRAMGVFAPDAKLFKDKNGKTVMVENFVEGTPLGQYLEKSSFKQYNDIINQIKDTTYADVLLGNWDAAGTPDATAGEYPNMMVVNGQLCRIDPGGWGRFRAQGAPKKHDDWEAGFPCELFSMFKFGTSKDFIQDLTPYDLATQIAGKDLLDLMSVLPKSDAEVMQKRIRECRDLAETGKNYVVDGGYTKDFASSVMEFSLEINRRGGREALNYGDISCEDCNEKTMAESATSQGETEHGNSSPSLEKAKIRKKIAELTAGSTLDLGEAKLAISDAVKAVNFSADNGLDMPTVMLKYAMTFESQLNAAHAQLEAAGDEESWSNNSIVQECLDWIKPLKEVMESGKLKNIGEWKAGSNSSVKIHIYPTDEDLNEANLWRDTLSELESAHEDGINDKELIGMTPMEIQDRLCEIDNAKSGLHASYQLIKEALLGQGMYTWPSNRAHGTHMMKIAEYMAMGGNPADKPVYDDKSTNRIFNNLVTSQYLKTQDGKIAYCGSVVAPATHKVKGGKKGEMELYHNIGESTPTYSSATSYNEAIDSSLETGDIWSFYRAFAAMKAVQSATFANSRFEHADRNSVMLKRVLKKEIVDYYGLQHGMYNVFPCGFSDSATYGKTCYDPLDENDTKNDSFSTLTRCPVSRLTGLCCWDNPFEHKYENEFGANLVGLPQLLVRSGDINTEDNQEHRYDLLKEFEKNNPKQTDANTYTYVPQFLS